MAGNDFYFGALAKERFYKNDPNAFGNYFEIIKDPSRHFDIYGNKKPVKQLFYHGVEQFLSHFIHTVLYKSDSIESYRHFPLRFVFEADIEDQEKVLIEALFTEAGYFNVKRVDLTAALFKVLIASGIVERDGAILLLSSIDNKLFLQLYKRGFSDDPSRIQLEGQGADTRVKILAEMILEYIVSLNPFLNIDTGKELGTLLSFCKTLLDQDVPIITGEAELTDGQKYWFRITARNLSERLKYYSSDLIIYTAIDDLLRSNGIHNDAVTLLVASEELNTPYFLEKLLKKYIKVKAVDQVHLNEAMKCIFSQIDFSNPIGRRNISAPPASLTKPGLPPLPSRKEVTSVPVITKPKLPPLPPKKN
ncbi:hypothetical protein [Pedobacter sp. MC2016-24]|uniref:hypothetical protein n=1 Tax=Pedobacter sp. MC2016-24 TaxID=2780090 RepID=UPI0018815D47|nr:hypothetical protein [Pedobacter sp. MC2016-24]MBE9602271.1 hypothetical protein [Pedobacter sp. MC2016-24]